MGTTYNFNPLTQKMDISRTDIDDATLTAAIMVGVGNLDSDQKSIIRALSISDDAAQTTALTTAFGGADSDALVANLAANAVVTAAFLAADAILDSDTKHDIGVANDRRRNKDSDGLVLAKAFASAADVAQSSALQSVITGAISGVTTAFGNADSDVTAVALAADKVVTTAFQNADSDVRALITASGSIAGVTLAFQNADSDIRVDFVASDVSLTGAFVAADAVVTTAFGNADSDTLAAAKVFASAADATQTTALTTAFGNADSDVTAVAVAADAVLITTFVAADAVVTTAFQNADSDALVAVGNLIVAQNTALSSAFANADSDALVASLVADGQTNQRRRNQDSDIRDEFPAADVVVTAAFVAADAVVTTAFQNADSDALVANLAANVAVTTAFGNADAVVTTAFGNADSDVTAAAVAANAALQASLLTAFAAQNTSIRSAFADADSDALVANLAANAVVTAAHVAADVVVTTAFQNADSDALVANLAANVALVAAQDVKINDTDSDIRDDFAAGDATLQASLLTAFAAQNTSIRNDFADADSSALVNSLAANVVVTNAFGAADAVVTTAFGNADSDLKVLIDSDIAINAASIIAAIGRIASEKTKTLLAAKGGFEQTSGFTDYVSGALSGVDAVTDANYAILDGADAASAPYDSSFWYRIGFDGASNISADAPNWANGPNIEEAPHSGTTDYQGTGLFGGAYMAEGVTNMFNFDSAISGWTDSAHVGPQKERMNSATGSFDMSQLRMGDEVLIDMNLNIIPQSGTTLVSAALIIAKRDSAGGAVTGTEIIPAGTFNYSKSDFAGVCFPESIRINHVIRSEQDLHANALVAIKGNKSFKFQPLSAKFNVRR